MKRFLCNREDSYNVSDDGFLSDPDGEYGRYLNPNVIALDDLLACRCLIVLGEPGIGKSTELERVFYLEKQKAESSESVVLHFKLNQYQAGEELRRDIFEGDDIKRWKAGSHQLHLFLDDLDEGLLSIKTLAALLCTKLRELPAERLTIRIACRTAEWPQTLEKAVKAHWGDQDVKILEIVPLRRSDVAEYATSRGIDPVAFICQVIEKEVVPLAIKPLTLKFLVGIFSENKELPKTQAQLYADGCWQLCEEFNDSRVDAGKRSFLSADQLLAIAERIAAVTIFANCAAIRMRPNLDDVSDADITASKICGGIEEARGTPFQITEECIREAVKTGLFNSRGSNRMGWAHQTYAEFLAARYIKRHRMNIPQMMSLLTHPIDDNSRIIPQLHETAAWLARMDEEIFRAILKADPKVLLKSDIATVDWEDRHVLVEKLLSLFGQDELLDDDGNLRSRYRKLNHRNLADQLRPYICNVAKGLTVRQVAIDIAEACELKALQNELADVALDISQPMAVRVNASYAVIHIGDAETRARLKPLAFGRAGDDPDDQLKGCGLRAIWPETISVSELFSLLTSPKRPQLHGSYSQFLGEDCLMHLKPYDLVDAFNWIDESRVEAGSGTSLSLLRKKIIMMAWNNIGHPGILDRLTTLIAKSLRRIDNWNDDVFTHDESKRSLVIETLIPKLVGSSIDLFELTRSQSPLLRDGDIPFLLSLLQKEKSIQSKQILVGCIKQLFDINNISHTELIINESSREELLAEEFGHFLQFVELESSEAKLQKSTYYQRLAWQTNRGRSKGGEQQQPSVAETTAQILDRCEVGDFDAWAELNHHMGRSWETKYIQNRLESDLRLFPGWESANQMIRARILETAKNYLLNGEPKTSEWLGAKIISHRALSGYRALLLLYQEIKDYVFTLPPAVWKKWASIIVAYPIYSKIEESPHPHLVKLSYQNAPEETGEYLLRQIDKENKDGGGLVTLGKFIYCWDARFIALIESKLKDDRLSLSCFRHLLEELLDHGSDIAKQYAESVVHSSLDEKSAVAATVLFVHAPDCGWPVVWPLINQNAELGCSIMTSVAGSLHGHYKDIFEKLNESQMSELYIWLEHQFPHSGDSDYIGFDGSARNFRDAVLEYLKNKGTKEAVKAIGEIAVALPELTWLKWTILRAQNQMRQATWKPLQPEIILELAANRQKRLIQNGEQLLEVLIESLDRLAQKLHGETPAVTDLWNQLDKKRFRPKDEPHLSDYIKRHLADDLNGRAIVINREVEIRRRPGASLGERTDIRVDAITHTHRPEEFDKISVIIEVKGCWNIELKNAMQTQLRDRYLNEAHCNCGLYLVGWFLCDLWDSDDYRRDQSPKIAINALESQLTDQANRLSVDGLLLKTYVLNTALDQ